MTIQQKELCNKIIENYGFNSQLGILIEECAELIQAASKLIRNKKRMSENFIEELADVSIMLEQMQHTLREDEKAAFEATINRKLKRQLARMNGGLELNCTNCGRQCDSRAGINKFCGNYQPAETGRSE